jgi:putative superfamily III holin-X
MDMPASPPPEPSIGDLFGRLADESKAYVRAEAEVCKAVAARRLANARGGAIALVAAALLMNAALGTLVICLALGLAPMVGPVAAGLIVFAAVAFVCFFLVRFGASRMKALGGDAEERAALAAERRP